MGEQFTISDSTRDPLTSGEQGCCHVESRNQDESFLDCGATPRVARLVATDQYRSGLGQTSTGHAVACRGDQYFGDRSIGGSATAASLQVDRTVSKTGD